MRWRSITFVVTLLVLPMLAMGQSIPEQVWQAQGDTIHRDGCPELSKVGGIRIARAAIGRSARFCPVCFPDRSKERDDRPAEVRPSTAPLPETVWVSGHTIHQAGCPELRATGGVSTASAQVANSGLVRCSVCFSPGFKPAPPRAASPAQPQAASKPRWWEYLAMGIGAFAEGYAAGAGQTGLTGPTTPVGIGKKLMLFGGKGHQTYLGCLSCGQLEPDSIQNEFGKFGNKFAPDSIFNPLGQFGSRYSAFSICNPYAAEPPIIVDSQGGAYGVLTANSRHIDITKSAELRAFVAGACAGR